MITIRFIKISNTKNVITNTMLVYVAENIFHKNHTRLSLYRRLIKLNEKERLSSLQV